MNITLHKLGKRFEREWIFRNISVELHAGNSYAVLGPNGSGKSTLLQTIAGSLTPSTGTITFDNGRPIDKAQVYRHIGYSAPYMQLMEEFSLREQMHFHQKFKPFVNGLTPDELIGITGLQASADKWIGNFSSGMKQRVKLVLAILSDVPVILLDEPATNLDSQGVEWYRQLVAEHAANRLLLVGSNRADEYDFCGETIDILQYK